MLRPLLLLITCLSAPLISRAESPRPNVVFIISDDQAWTDYGFMSHPEIKTPHLDKLSRESLVFKRGYVPSSLCCPSLASVLTGRYPHQNKITGNEPPRPVAPKGEKPKNPYLDPVFAGQVKELTGFMEKQPRLPAELGKVGYLSLQTGKWWAENFSTGGFTEGMSKGDIGHGGRHGDEGLDIGRKSMEPIYDFITRAKAKQKPFFLWYAPMLPHQPHDPPQRLLDKYRDKTPSLHVAKYWANCELFDETCGALLKNLEDQGVAQNTIVIYLADNGWIQDPSKPKFRLDSKLSQYDGGLRTPIMVRWPGKVEPKMSDIPVSTVDIAPTIYKALELPLPEGQPGLNLLDEKAIKERDSAFGACFLHNAVDIHDPAKNLTYRWCVVGDWKLILPKAENITQANRDGREIGEVELYNITKDPTEEKNLAKDTPDKVAELTKKLDAWWAAK